MSNQSFEQELDKIEYIRMSNTGKTIVMLKLDSVAGTYAADFRLYYRRIIKSSTHALRLFKLPGNKTAYRVVRK